MNIITHKKEYLGYEKIGNIRPVDITSLRKFYTSANLNRDIASIFSVPASTLDSIKSKTQAFYDQHFKLHSVDYLDIYNLPANLSYLDLVERKTEIAPFDIPIEIVPGHTMVGQVQKSVPVVSKEITQEYGKILPFFKVELGEQLTDISAATYAHEIAHTQLESNFGYAKDMLNKETIPIFLEKVALSEIDPSGQLLKQQETARSAYLATNLDNISCAYGLSPENNEGLLDCYISAYSTVLANKLFDDYQNSPAKRQRKMLKGIQHIFDGESTVEQFLDKNSVSFHKANDIKVLSKHL